MATVAKSSSRQALANGTPGNPSEFRQLATNIAARLLVDWVGKERAGEATGRIAAALSSSAASAKKPEDFYTCTPASIANCVAIAALTGVMPGTGPAALAYLVPRSPRRGEQKQLGFMFSHRGLNALAGRSGYTMVAMPVSFKDSISVNSDGEVTVGDIDFDNPPTEFEELRGVVVVVKRIETGAVVTRGWMPRKLIEKRRDGSDSYTFASKPGNEWAKDSDPWHKWPVEMAMKTAMHYAVSRGWCVIDDAAATRALAYDAAMDAITVQSSSPAMLQGPSSLDQLADKLSAPSDAQVIDTTADDDADPQYPGGEIPEEGETPLADENPLAGFTDRLKKCKAEKEVTALHQEYLAKELNDLEANTLDDAVRNKLEAMK